MFSELLTRSNYRVFTIDVMASRDEIDRWSLLQHDALAPHCTAGRDKALFGKRDLGYDLDDAATVSFLPIATGICRVDC